jgi:hypothetical protein
MDTYAPALRYELLCGTCDQKRSGPHRQVPSFDKKGGGSNGAISAWYFLKQVQHDVLDRFSSFSLFV